MRTLFAVLTACLALAAAAQAETLLIKAATINAADLLSLETEIGTVEAGKSADIIAVDQDPMREVKTLERMRFVMRAGTVYVGP